MRNIFTLEVHKEGYLSDFYWDVRPRAGVGKYDGNVRNKR